MHFVKILQVYTDDLCTFQDVYYLKKKRKRKENKQVYKKESVLESNSQGSNPGPITYKICNWANYLTSLCSL